MNGLPEVTANLAKRDLIVGGLLMISGSIYTSTVVDGVEVDGVVVGVVTFTVDVVDTFDCLADRKVSTEVVVTLGNSVSSS